MSIVTASGSLAPELPFKFIAGDPSLDFVNTVDWTKNGLVAERLTEYARLLEWARLSAVLPALHLSRLRARAARSPGAAQEALDAARRGRWVVHRLFESVVTGKRSADALAEFDTLLRDAHEHLTLAWPRDAASPSGDRAGTPLRWEWRDDDERLDAMLWPVVRSAATLLASEEASQVRICGGPECGWMYVDRSRNGLRRWCEMSVCGTREKSRRRAARRQVER